MKTNKNSPMTVGELIAVLQKFPPDHVALMSNDEEGNRIHEVGNIEVEYDKVIIFPTH